MRAGPGHIHAIIRIPPVRPSLSNPPHPTVSNACICYARCGLQLSACCGEETLTSFLRERVFSKNTYLHGSVPLSKLLTFAKEPSAKKPGEELMATAVEMGRTALKAMINLVEISQCVDLPQLLEHRAVDFVQLQQHIQENANEQAHPEALSLQCLCLQEP